MEDLINYIPAILIWSPILLSIIIYQLHFRLKKSKWKSIHFTVQSAAPFFIAAAALLVYKLFQLNITGYLLIALICLLAIILVMQWKKDTEVLLLKGVKLLLRLSFLIGGAAYIVLLVYYIFQNLA